MVLEDPLKACQVKARKFREKKQRSFFVLITTVKPSNASGMKKDIFSRNIVVKVTSGMQFWWMSVSLLIGVVLFFIVVHSHPSKINDVILASLQIPFLPHFLLAEKKAQIMTGHTCALSK
ncbi:uncharacterized protein A4U43_C04F21220 [Asparagus officinalis]|uniref:Uncharacterized protein n=1 Tax=Asparagus officinalis TaxID=4686 RepID=A0A5P1F375_ASPOF|nr:uncharacterized protein A4U43_C04F21220 [Asparagus officinalis]